MSLHSICRVTASLCIAALAACTSENPIRCGAGTELIAGECLPILDGGESDARVVGEQVQASCGDHAFEVDGVCHGVQPVGSACSRGAECDTQTCMPEADGFPGGYCSIPSCNDQRPCTLGSHCVYSSKRDITICLAFCSGTTACREGYVCQPLYDGNISVCAPACREDADCPDQARCDDGSGLCVLRECDPRQPDGCDDGRVCFPDPRQITKQGGLCLTTCDPSSSECQDEDVCQPLADDPARQGVCAPPVCQETKDCPTGAMCRGGACQPPPRCDAKGACSDQETACVGGPGGQCLPRCSNDGSCRAIQDGLVCAAGLAQSSVCMPIGSFPGGACRTNAASACDSLTVKGTPVPMRCENDRCLAECSSGGDARCKSLGASLSCASGVFDRPVCLPSGSYPGGPCAGDTCFDAEVAAGKSAKMLCKGGQCLLDCSPEAIGGDDANAYCRAVDGSLTCAATVYPDAAVCLPEGSYPGGPCAHGMCSDYSGRSMLCADDRCVVSCTPDDPATGDREDSCGSVAPTLTCARGVLPQDVCLPTGSFPGSPCAGPNRNECAQDLNGVAAVDMQCVNGACAIGCNEANTWAGFGEALCRFANPALTCAQAAGSVCVTACNNGNCPPGYACLDAGEAPAHENACLPARSQ